MSVAFGHLPFHFFIKSLIIGHSSELNRSIFDSKMFHEYHPSTSNGSGPLQVTHK